MGKQNRYRVIVSERATQMLVSHAAKMYVAHRRIYPKKRLLIYPV